MSNPLKKLAELGQSVWYDYIRRDLYTGGELRRLIEEDGLSGMTSNPTIFQKAIAETDLYDGSIRRLSGRGLSGPALFEALEVKDVRAAADVFRPVFDRTGGDDGFVSIEVNPALSHDTEGTVSEARRLWRACDRPNVMVKIPGTTEGIPAIRAALAEGININITLLFSVEHYRAVAEAYLRALETRLAEGQPIDRIASVASFFVSRVDTEVDKRIQSQGGALMPLRGKAAIAGAQLAYAIFAEISRSPRWQALAAKGARPQRLLWASTGTKNPDYSDVMYVESLIGPDTITTVPPETLTLFEDHGRVARTLDNARAVDAAGVIDALAAGGIDLGDVNRVLEDEGIDKFAKSFDKLLAAIREPRAAIR